MFSTNAAIVALLLFISSLLVACLPHGARNDRQVVFDEAPDFFLDLYYCWRDRAEGSSLSMEVCLLEAGEDNASIVDILLADKVVGFKGQG